MKPRVLIAANQKFPPFRLISELLPEMEVREAIGDDILARIAEADVLVSTVQPIRNTVIEAGRFGLIQQFGVGVDAIDIDAATRAGVWVARVPARDCGNAVAVAEHAMLLVLALARQLPTAKENVRRGLWSQPCGLSLYGKTAVVAGLGDLGTEIAKRANAFGMKVLAVREHTEKGIPEGVEVDRLGGVPELDEMLGEADFVIVSLNLHARNRHFFDARRLAAIKPGAYFVNVARGGAVDTNALTEALASGHLAGAGLDVFEREPVDFSHPLFRQNVIATPHVAGITDLSVRGIARGVANNIRRFLRGETPLHVVNKPSFVRSDSQKDFAATCTGRAMLNDTWI